MSTPGRIKNLFFVLAAAAGFAIFVECLSFMTFWMIEGRPLSLARLDAERASLAHAKEPASATETSPVPNPAPQWVAPEVVHPYLGYVEDRKANEPEVVKYHHYPVNDYGFIDDKAPIQTRAPGRVIVGIVGGSFAYWFSVYGTETFLAELRKSPLFAGKEILIVRLALGGYKQPQQLMVLDYLLALGAEFDIVINIDGFNDVALPVVENVPKKVFPFFPRAWFLRVNTLPDAGTSVLVGRIEYLRSQRSQWAVTAMKLPWRYSMTANLIWRYRDNGLAASLSQAQLELQAYQPSAGTYAARGPARQYETDAALFADLAAVWQRASLQIHRLCAANGIAYFHFLQPNQYVPGTKSMGAEERKQAFIENHPYRKAVEGGYPDLIAAGAELVRQGVQFHDLTGIFSNTPEPIYADTCCHVNEQGNEMLATRIAETIVNDFAKRSQPGN